MLWHCSVSRKLLGMLDINIFRISKSEYFHLNLPKPYTCTYAIGRIQNEINFDWLISEIALKYVQWCKYLHNIQTDNTGSLWNGKMRLTITVVVIAWSAEDVLAVRARVVHVIRLDNSMRFIALNWERRQNVTSTIVEQLHSKKHNKPTWRNMHPPIGIKHLVPTTNIFT